MIGVAECGAGTKRTYDVVDPGCLMSVTGECRAIPNCAVVRCKLHKETKWGEALREAGPSSVSMEMGCTMQWGPDCDCDRRRALQEL